jgi:replicative DNA helicase
MQYSKAARMSDQAALQAVEAEQSVLGGLLQDAQAFDRIVGVVGEGDFASKDHRAIFRAISRLFDGGKPVDVITAAEFLESHKLLNECGGLEYLGKLTQITPSAANIKRYAEIVRERAILRKLAASTMEISEAVHNRGGRTARELLDFAQTKVSAVSESINRKDAEFVRAADLVDGALAHIHELGGRKNKSEITGLATGFIDFDKMTTGLHPGDLVIVAGRPSMGKTSLAMNVAEFVALEETGNVAFFSMEMTNGQLMYRLLSSVSRLNQHRAKVGQLNATEFDKLHEAANKLREVGLYLNETGALTINEVRAMSRRLHREVGGLHLIVIDYIQLMQSSERRDNRALEVEEISRGLKALAKELHLPVIALSQLNRGLEQRPNKRPIMSDLRDSGAIEQDADLIAFIYRDEVYNPETPDKGIAEIIIGKQRNGPTGTVFATWVNHLTRFENRAHSPIPSHAVRNEKRSKRAGNFRAENDVSGGGYVEM